MTRGYSYFDFSIYIVQMLSVRPFHGFTYPIKFFIIISG